MNFHTLFYDYKKLFCTDAFNFTAQDPTISTKNKFFPLHFAAKIIFDASGILLKQVSSYP